MRQVGGSVQQANGGVRDVILQAKMECAIFDMESGTDLELCGPYRPYSEVLALEELQSKNKQTTKKNKVDWLGGFRS